MAAPNLQQEQLQEQATSPSAQLDLGISLALNAWPALTLAVQSSWGGPTSADKRDWFCGAISELLNDRPETDAEDLEDVLIQVMNDEFDVVVDDGSAGDVALQIMELKAQTQRGEFSEIRAMYEAWKEKMDKKGASAAGLFRQVDARDEDQETDDDDDDEEEEDDVEMDEAPTLTRAPRERVEPEVDEEGFTKVVGKKKR
ncbi:rRNA accumulation-related protein [Paecilomyces lecythidis]|uniref:rRNA accumulation-related protein n=1 Tax=Paecilomyces lecythidis TaxID=3004212 RepID=A0ABR3Y4G8_9EURO